MANTEHAKRIACRFPVITAVTEIAAVDGGLINDSFKITTPGGCYALQRINPQVFTTPQQIIANLVHLQSAAQNYAAAAPRLPRLYPAADGHWWQVDAAGSYWRLWEWIDGAPLVAPPTTAQAAEIGRILGQFHRFTTTLDPQTFTPILPHLHDSARYWDQLQAQPPTPEIAPLLELIDHRRAWLLSDDRLAQLPIRIVHGDPKCNNLLFDHRGSQAIAWIDLDTIQPGLLIQDIADCLRSNCQRDQDDRIGFDLDCAEMLLTAYAQQVAGLLEHSEIDCLFAAIRLMPFELCLRFLADHLAEDRYFRVQYRGENFHKAHRQLQLAIAIDDQQTALAQIIARCWSSTV